MDLHYGFSKVVEKPFEDVLNETKDELVNEGFGILTTINVKEKFKEKLGIDYRNYVILGACNPPSAYKAIESEENIGLILPCNVIVYEKGGNTVVSVIKPTVAMQMIDNKALNEIAVVIETKLKSVFDRI